MISDISTRIEQNAASPWDAVRARAGWLTAAALVAIIIIGAVFRLTGMNWDDYTHLHPDERFLTMVTNALSFPGEPAAGRLPAGCDEWGGYFDSACSPLSPYNHDFGLFVYGTFPIFLTRMVGEFLNQTGYDEIHLVGRALSALFDLSTVLLIFLIGRRMYGVRAGLLAALFLAASVLDIQQAHFFTVDTFTNVPILIAFWYALDIAEGKNLKSSEWGITVALVALIALLMIGFVPGLVALLALSILLALLFSLDNVMPVRYGLAGIAFGLALAGRINIAPFAAVLIAAAALRAYRQALDSRRSLNQGPEPLSAVPRDPSSAPAEETKTRAFGPLSVSVTWRSRAAAAEPVMESFEDAITRFGTRAFVGLAVIALLALFVFRVFQPYAANGPSLIAPHIPKLDLSRGPINFALDVALSWAGGVNPKFADNMTYINDLMTGKIDSPPGHQWTNRPAYVFPFENMVQWGLGLPLGLAGWVGFLLALYQLIRYRRWEHLLIVVWVGITFGYSGQQFVKTMRYFLQIYPFLCLLAAWFIVELWDRVSARLSGVIESQSRQIAARGLQAAVALTAVVVIGYTLFYATAFMSIYTHPYTRVAASRWIFANVPVGSVVANEHWDDPLPVRIDGKDPWGGMYRNLSSSPDGEMDWYNEDTPEKRDQAIQWLDETEYIILSSNRLYGSIPRLPMRYPLTTKYYQWLFNGTLGFDKVAEFTSRPQLFGIEINDDNAEEAFTVYDHPKVLIFKKTARYSHANTSGLFNSVDLSEVYRFTPREATEAPTALLLTPEQREAQATGGTWSRIFNPQDWINQIPVVGWLGLVELLGWLTFPLAFVVFRALDDRGYIFAKGLGLLLPAWGAFSLASYDVLPFSRLSILIVLSLVALASAACVVFRGREIWSFLKSHYRIVLIEQVLFLMFFGIDLLIRYGNPDLWHPNFGGEKPMDFAQFNAVTKSTWFPAYDPWFAGGYLNYYYFGQVINATLERLSGIIPQVAYNLALPMYFALLAMGAFSVVWNLIAHVTTAHGTGVPAESLDKPTDLGLLQGRHAARSESEGVAKPGAESPLPPFSREADSVPPYDGVTEGRSPVAKPSEWAPVVRNAAFALLGALFVALIGNLGELLLLGQVLLNIGGGDMSSVPAMVAGVLQGFGRVFLGRQPIEVPLHWWYWNASRVIPDTINEFPFFTFLYADLHAHLMALPYTLLTIGLGINFMLRRNIDDARLRFWPYLQISPQDVIEVTVAGLVLGALRAINFADFPTYALVITCALAIGEYARRGKIDLDGIVAVVWRLIAILLLSSILFQSFISHFQTAYLAIEPWRGAQTTLGQYITVHGIFLFVIATYLIWESLQTPLGRGTLRIARIAVRKPARLGRFLALQHTLSAPPSASQDLILILIGVALMVELAFVLIFQQFVFAFVFPLLVLAGLLVLHPSLGPARRFIALLVAAGLALTLVVEVIVYKGDIGRMNTVFKFYNQVWVLFAIAAATGLAYIVNADGRHLYSGSTSPAHRANLFTARGRRSAVGSLHWVWWTAFGFLVFAGLMYPFMATRAKVNDRFVAGSPPGLNGMDYMDRAVYNDKDQPLPLIYDRQAIEWMQENIQGSPVVLEGNAPLYHWGSRVSVYTGLPTVIGWDWHEKQQRSIIDGAIVDHRIGDVQTMYNTVDVAQTLYLLDRYHVAYIYVGDLERAFYNAKGIAKFDAMAHAGQLELVYQNDHVQIYKVGT